MANASGTKRKSDDNYNASLKLKRELLSASLINPEDLDALGVFYDDDFVTVTDFLKMLKKRKCRAAFPDIARYFDDLTNEHLKLTLDTDAIPDINIESGPAIEERELIEYLDEESKNLEQVRLCEMKKWNVAKDDLKIVLFSEWISSAKKFIELTQDMIQRLILCRLEKNEHDEESAQKEKEITNIEVEENIYTDVFARFTEMFFLLPRTGRRSSVLMNDKIVPDIRYYQYIPRGAPYPVLLMFWEVKKVPVQRSVGIGKETWINKNLSQRVLGQIGLELVSECFRSAFLPNVLGVVSMRTEVIFVYLTITSDHAKAIHNNESTENMKAYIHYTKAFDIMKREDRKQISELLFWLGCVQKYNLRRYYLKE